MTIEIDKSDLKGLLRAIQDSDIVHFHLVTADHEILISREEGAAAPSSGAVPGNSALSAPTSAHAAASPRVTAPSAPAARTDTAPPGAASGPADPTLVEVPSPMIGIFYRAPEPGAAPFVTPGAEVEADSTVGLIEAMKLFTAVEAGTAGAVAEVLAENGEYVEFGQPLLRIRPRS